ncbi:MAG: hypothetical protein KKH94_11225 [Candidatus Omnitrophica bacterium]|nr:hypothetical protein [Candidatus Omnitrophota bacterium]
MSSVSPFTRALAYQSALHAQEIHQIRAAFSAMNGNGIITPKSSVPSRPSVKSVSSGGDRSPSRARPQTVSNNTPVRRSTAQPVAASSGGTNRVQRNMSAQAAERGVGVKRNRKAIANTQADKKGTDSTGMTSLATSGIDGKGLKINRIR